jgi:sugar O-acyltransferase (sialic acid O-acetyltransferase NeuD family)
MIASQTAPPQTAFVLYIAGAGGFGREVAAYAAEIIASGRLSANLGGFLDDTDADPAALGCALPVVATINSWRPRPTDRVVVAVGDPINRRQVALRLAGLGARFVTLVHPTAWVAANARLGEGCIVAPLAAVAPHAEIGDHSVVNVQAGIGHDVRLGAYSVLAPHAVLNGFVSTGEGVLIGSAAVVTAHLSLGDGARVAAGSVLYSDVPAKATAHGNPARVARLPT